MAVTIPEFKEGERVSAGSLNLMTAEIGKAANTTGDGDLEVMVNATGRHFRLNRPDMFFAKITSGTGPYAWTEVVRVGTSWVSPSGARTGTTSSDQAYEFNGYAVPINSVVKLRFLTSGERVFKFIRHGSSCVGQICVTVFACGGNWQGATVTVTPHGSTTVVGTCTTNSSGACCVPITSAGSYDVTVAAGGTSQTSTIAATCTTNFINFFLDPPTIKFTVKGCNGTLLPGATVTVLKSGSPIGSAITNSSGVANVDVTGYNGSPLTATIACPRFITQTVTLNATTCTYGPYTLLPAAGYTCCAFCVLPYPSTIYATVDGTAVTLTLNSGAWRGSFTKTVTGLDWSIPYGCSSKVPNYTSITVCFNVSMTCGSFAPDLGVSWPVSNQVNSGGTPTANQHDAARNLVSCGTTCTVNDYTCNPDGTFSLPAIGGGCSNDISNTAVTYNANTNTSSVTYSCAPITGSGSFLATTNPYFTSWTFSE